MMVCLPLSLVFGVIGIFLDSSRWLAFAIALIALLLLLPSIAGIFSNC